MEHATILMSNAPGARAALEQAVLCEWADLCLHSDRTATRLQWLAGAMALGDCAGLVADGAAMLALLPSLKEAR